MACLSPSPSGRRLSELLEERQEPFSLDLHLLEKGCSAQLLEGYDTALCWPAAGNDVASVLKRLTSKKKKKKAASTRSKKKQQPEAGTGLLRLLLSKILHGKAANRKPAALQFSDSFKMVGPSPCSKHLDAVKTGVVVEDVDEEGMEYSDSDDDEKQLSPVSVLEHPFDSSPIHNQSKCSNVQGSPKNAMAIVRELLEVAYSPALLTQLLGKSEDLVKDTAVWGSGHADLDHDSGDDCYYYLTSPKNVCDDDDDEAAAMAVATTTSAAYWDTHRAELSMVSELVASEVPRSRLDAADVEPERRDVGADLEAAVLEALLQELVVDLRSFC